MKLFNWFKKEKPVLYASEKTFFKYYEDTFCKQCGKKLKVKFNTPYDTVTGKRVQPDFVRTECPDGHYWLEEVWKERKWKWKRRKENGEIRTWNPPI